MKFNEKLMELRKKEGLSQEELGYKLDVTRQTVSKWELGQTTPEMDKLLEISKLFNMSVDELIKDDDVLNNIDQSKDMNQNPVIEQKLINDKSNKANKIYLLLIGALIIVIILIIVKGASAISSKNKIENTEPTIFSSITSLIERVFGLFDKALTMQENMLEQQDNIINGQYDEIDNGKTEEIVGNVMNQMNTSVFNVELELFIGTQDGSSLKSLLDKVITRNKKEERKITVIYNEINTQDTTEIKNLKMQFNNFDDFEVSFEYDQEGYIYEVMIEKYEQNVDKNTEINMEFNNVMTDYNKIKEQIENNMMQIGM